MHANRDVLDVQQDIEHVFLHAFDCAVLVNDAIDLHFGDRGARDRRQQDAAQGIAERMADASFLRFKRDTRLVRRKDFNACLARLDKAYEHVLPGCNTLSETGSFTLMAYILVLRNVSPAPLYVHMKI